jgi:hypothetical protein
MNYKKIIDALVVLNKNSKGTDFEDFRNVNFLKLSKKIQKTFGTEMFLVAPDFMRSFKDYSNYLCQSGENSLLFKIIDLYKVKDLVITKLIEHGQLVGNTYHQFSRGGFSLSLGSKFAKKDETGKLIGEFHSGCDNTPKKYRKLRYDGKLPSYQDKEAGFYKAKFDLGQALYILSDFLDDETFSPAKSKKNLAIAKRRNLI